MNTLRSIKPLAGLRNPGRTGGNRGELQWLRTGRLFIDDAYQRPISVVGEKNIAKIAREFSWALFSPLIVAARDGGRYAIIDGQHRATAAVSLGLAELPCFIIDADEQLQALAFATINGNVTKIASQALFRARLAAGDRDAVRLRDVCARAGVEICGYPIPASKMRAGQTLAVGTLEQCFRRHGEEILVMALSTITKTGDGNTGFVREGIIAGTCDVAAEWPKANRAACCAALIQSIEAIGIPALYARALKMKGDAGNSSGSVRQFYAEALRKSLDGALRAPPARVALKVNKAVAPPAAPVRAIAAIPILPRPAVARREIAQPAGPNAARAKEILAYLGRNFDIEPLPNGRFRYGGHHIDFADLVNVANRQRRIDGLALFAEAAA